MDIKKLFDSGDESSDTESTTDYNAMEDEIIMEKHSQLAKAFTEGAESSVYEEIVQKKTNKAIRALTGFLSNNINFRTRKADDKTNIIDIGEKKTYHIPKENMIEMFNLLENCRRDGAILHYQERQNRESSGIMIDIDRYQKSPVREITERHLLTFAQVVARLMYEVIDFSEHVENGEEFKMNVFFIQKPQPVLDKVSKYAKEFSADNADAGADDDANSANTDGADSANANSTRYKGPVYKDGFHMLIPEIMINRGAKVYLINQIIKKKVMENVFKGIDMTIQPAYEMLDTASSYVNVCFFGNTKGPLQAYNLTTIAEVSLSTDMLSDGVVCNLRKLSFEDFAECNLVYELSLCFYFEHILKVSFKKEGITTPGRKSTRAELNSSQQMIGFGGYEADSVNEMVPTKLKKKHYEYRKILEADIQHLGETRRGRGILDEDAEDTESSVSVLTLHDPEAALIKSLLGLLDARFARDYEMWRNIIFALAHTSPTYKPLAEWFSQRIPNSYDKEGLESLWRDALARAGSVPNPVTKRYIRHWARQCNPEKYKELLNNTYHQILHVFALTYDGVVQHAMVAKILLAMLNEKFVTDVENRENRAYKYVWYEFVLPEQKHIKGQVYKWRKEYEPSVLHIYIADHLPKIYANVQQYIDDKKDDADSDGLTKYWANVSKTFKNYTSKLSDNGFQNGVINQAKYRFSCPGFIDELDSYEDVIGVGNGVLRVGREPKLFTGFHEYKISKFTETVYIPYSPSNFWMELIEQMYRSLYPEPDVCHWMKMWDSQSVEPRESDAAVLFWVGGGSNGKSTKVESISKTLGKQYSCKIPITLLTNDHEGASSANSAYSMMEGRTHVRFSEPNRLMNLNTGRLKEMFGGEDQSSREVYGAQKNWEMKATPTVVSNWDFNTDCTDEGFWRRCYYYRSKVKFVQEPNPDNKYEVKKDERFMKEFKKNPQFHEAMLSYMVENNKIFHTKYDGNIERVPCPTIRKETEQWRNRQDTIDRFITQRIVKIVVPTANVAENEGEGDGNDNANAGAKPQAVVYDPYSAGAYVPEYPLNIVASKYSEWYSENIGKNYNEDISSIIMQFENSCLQGSLERQNDGSMILKGHRIRESASDPIRKNEVLVGSFLEKKEIQAVSSNMTTATHTNNSDFSENNIIELFAPPEDLTPDLYPRADTHARGDSHVPAQQFLDPAEIGLTEFDILEKSLEYSHQGEGKIPLESTTEIKKMDTLLRKKAIAEDRAEANSKVHRMQKMLDSM